MYGITGKTGDVNALVSEWIACDPTKQARTIGNAVSTHTLTAIRSWGCSVGDITNIVVVYPDALFGADVKLSDQFVPQYDNAPGKSLGICLEGGVQSFLQIVNMLHLNVPVIAVEQLRGPTNKACLVDGNYLSFFSAAEFLSLIKKMVEKAHLERREINQEEIEKIRDAYLHNSEIHGPYNFEHHKHLRVFANPTRPDYGTKMDLFVTAFHEFFEHRIWEKLDLLTVVDCEIELKNRATAKSVQAMIAMMPTSSSPIYNQQPKTSAFADPTNMHLPYTSSL